ncbi:hypothetical protein FRC02_010266 [Tulasnella sp. 418]|nr:hypothetical protein FRC02_010266 [Tulasnella sp. 418]
MLVIRVQKTWISCLARTASIDGDGKNSCQRKYEQPMGMNKPSFQRAFASLGDSCGPSLRVIKGLGITDDISFLWPGQVDPVTILVSKTPNLEVLEIIGQGTDDLEPSSPIVPVPPPSPLSLNHLHTLSLVATPVSPVVVSLIETPLPSLSTLTMTSYHTHEQDEQAIIATQLGLAPSPVGMIGGFPGPMHDGSTTSTLTSLFLEKHGQNLTSLILCSASDWPPVPFTPPPNLLKSAPNLRHLTLLSKATGPPDPILFEQPDQPHPLETITLNKPVDGLLQCLDECMKPPRNTAFSIKQVGRSPQTARNWTPSKGKLPNLTCVHFLAVKWLRMRGIPMNAGTNGGMKEWSLVLRRYGIKVYDMEDKEL